MARLAEDSKTGAAFVSFVTGPPTTANFKVELDKRNGFETQAFLKDVDTLLAAWDSEIGAGIFPVRIATNLSDSSIQVTVHPVDGK